MLRLFAGYRREEVTFGPVLREPEGFVLPDERRFGFFFARLELARPVFSVQHDVAFFLRDEDFDLGDALSLELGYSPQVWRAQEAVRATLQWSHGLVFPRGFLVGSLSAATRARSL